MAKEHADPSENRAQVCGPWPRSVPSRARLVSQSSPLPQGHAPRMDRAGPRCRHGWVSASVWRLSPWPSSSAVLSAHLALVSERLSSVLGPDEEDSSRGHSRVQLSLRAPHLEPREQEVSAGCGCRAGSGNKTWGAGPAPPGASPPRPLRVQTPFTFLQNTQQVVFAAPKPKTLDSLGLER